MADIFREGEAVTYYPIKESETDNRHWPAKVIGKSPSGRIRVEIQLPEKNVKRAVSVVRLSRQKNLSLA